MAREMVTFRLASGLRAQMRSYLAKRNEDALHVPWTESDFIRLAIAEKLAHMERSRKSGKRQPDGLDRESGLVTEVPGFNS